MTAERRECTFMDLFQATQWLPPFPSLHMVEVHGMGNTIKGFCCLGMRAFFAVSWIHCGYFYFKCCIEKIWCVFSFRDYAFLENWAVSLFLFCLKESERDLAFQSLHQLTPRKEKEKLFGFEAQTKSLCVYVCVCTCVGLWEGGPNLSSSSFAGLFFPDYVRLPLSRYPYFQGESFSLDVKNTSIDRRLQDYFKVFLTL